MNYFTFIFGLWLDVKHDARMCNAFRTHVLSSSMVSSPFRTTWLDIMYIYSLESITLSVSAHSSKCTTGIMENLQQGKSKQ